jgi:hypothetical protein
LWDPNELAYIDAHVDKLKPSIVFVGLNPSGDISQKPTWYNFHGNQDLREVIAGTQYEGAYITDLIKTPAPDAAALYNGMDAGQRIALHDKSIAAFIEELKALQTPIIKEMILFGREVERIIRRYRDRLQAELSIKQCREITHYSRTAGRFSEIGGKELLNPPEEKWLWK